jgi:hypothetical protein
MPGTKNIPPETLVLPGGHHPDHKVHPHDHITRSCSGRWYCYDCRGWVTAKSCYLNSAIQGLPLSRVMK